MALNFRPISILPVLSKLLESHVAVSLSAPYLAIFEQRGSADIFSLITGGSRDDTSKSVIVHGQCGVRRSPKYTTPWPSRESNSGPPS